jgi:hypothetical protein
MNGTGHGILERVAFHLRAEKRAALDADDVGAFQITHAALCTARDLLKVLKREQGTTTPRVLGAVAAGGMNLHLLAVDVKPSDFEWSGPAEKPEQHSVQPPAQPGSISGDELARRMRAYVETLLSKPGWQEELNKKNREAKEAKRRARTKAA